jgi:hypothetical protein
MVEFIRNDCFVPACRSRRKITLPLLTLFTSVQNFRSFCLRDVFNTHATSFSAGGFVQAGLYKRSQRVFEQKLAKVQIPAIGLGPASS